MILFLVLTSVMQLGWLGQYRREGREGAISWKLKSRNIIYTVMQRFFKENVRYPVWTCRDPISLILRTRFFLILGTRWSFSLILGTQFSILGTWIGSLKHLKKLCCTVTYLCSGFHWKPSFTWKFFLMTVQTLCHGETERVRWTVSVRYSK